MKNIPANAELQDCDFDGFSPEDVKCKGCNGPLCDEKAPRLYHGELIFVCHLCESGLSVLNRASERVRGLGE